MIEQEKINFIDEFTVISETLDTEKVEGVRHYSEDISGIEEDFVNL